MKQEHPWISKGVHHIKIFNYEKLSLQTKYNKVLTNFVFGNNKTPLEESKGVLNIYRVTCVCLFYREDFTGQPYIRRLIRIYQ